MKVADNMKMIPIKNRIINIFIENFDILFNTMNFEFS